MYVYRYGKRVRLNQKSTPICKTGQMDVKNTKGFKGMDARCGGESSDAFGCLRITSDDSGLERRKRKRNASNGVMHPQEIFRERLFERFYTGDVSRSAGGTGLGPAIVKLLVEEPGGTVGASLNGERLQIRMIIL